MPFPFIMTGPSESEAYFEQIDNFVKLTLGESACSKYQVIIDDPVSVAVSMNQGLQTVRKYRIKNDDAFYFNWRLQIDEDLQKPFNPTHSNMKRQKIDRSLPAYQLAANLRRVFSGIVAGNIKPEGLKQIREKGNFEISGEAEIMKSLDRLLSGFVADKRMKLPGGKGYQPCYRVLANT